jgi:uncharacterized caspase-like protein
MHVVLGAPVCSCVEQYRDPRTYFAFIVGNNKYTKISPLWNCVNDATDMRDLLLASGYPAKNVVTVLDGSHDDFRAALGGITQRLAGAVKCHVTVFYAGHAVEDAGGESVLLPVNADLSSDARMC